MKGEARQSGNGTSHRREGDMAALIDLLLQAKICPADLLLWLDGEPAVS